MIVIHFIFIVYHTNASVEFLQLNSAHKDDKYVPGRRQVRILEDLVIWQLCADIIQSSQSWLWPSTTQWSKQDLMWPEEKTKSPPPPNDETRCETTVVSFRTTLRASGWSGSVGRAGRRRRKLSRRNSTKLQSRLPHTPSIFSTWGGGISTFLY